jgi:DNA-binding transcriptional MerR regulator/effector-binding domain-containing protein
LRLCVEKKKDRGGIEAPLTGGLNLSPADGCSISSDLRQESAVFSIGEFSRITGLTVKTLRFYHEEGLLAPTSVDDQTGYRYYDGSLIELARTIAFLKSLDFPLAEIKELLALEREGEAPAEPLTAALEKQRRAIDERIRRLKRARHSLDDFLNAQREGKRLLSQATFHCEEKTVPQMKIAAVRMQAPYKDCGQGFCAIGKTFWNQICGPALLLCYDMDYQEIANYETCMPVKSGKSRDGIEVRDLPAGRCVALLHKGPYEQLGRSYEKALAYCKDKGYMLTSPCREIYIKGPGTFFKGNPKNYLTEIQLMIEG